MKPCSNHPPYRIKIKSETDLGRQLIFDSGRVAQKAIAPMMTSKEVKMSEELSPLQDRRLRGLRDTVLVGFSGSLIPLRTHAVV